MTAFEQLIVCPCCLSDEAGCIDSDVFCRDCYELLRDTFHHH